MSEKLAKLDSAFSDSNIVSPMSIPLGGEQLNITPKGQRPGKIPDRKMFTPLPESYLKAMGADLIPFAF